MGNAGRTPATAGWDKRVGLKDVIGREAMRDAAGVFALVLLTFFLHAAFSVPRMIGVAMGMSALWNPGHSPAPLEEVLYEGFDFLFAILAGVLAMAGCRLFVPEGRRPVIVLGAVPVILLYALLTIALQGRVPAYFFPVYLELAAAIPGWLLGYFLAGGPETRESFGLPRIAGVAIPAFGVVAAVVIAPLCMPFYTPGEVVSRPAVAITFHPVRPPPAPAASFTPPPAPGPYEQGAPDQLPVFGGGQNKL